VAVLVVPSQAFPQLAVGHPGDGLTGTTPVGVTVSVPAGVATTTVVGTVGGSTGTVVVVVTLGTVTGGTVTVVAVVDVVDVGGGGGGVTHAWPPNLPAIRGRWGGGTLTTISTCQKQGGSRTVQGGPETESNRTWPTVPWREGWLQDNNR
jgi:hypothetical protein